jgi:type I restriction enzyme S subunit
VKSGWQKKTIGDLCEVIAGQSPEGKFYNIDGKGMPFYQGKKDFGAKFIEAPTTWTTQSTKVAKEGDILMSVRAPVGPVNFATDEVCIGRGLAAIRSSDGLNRDFLFYQLWHLQPEISGREGAVFASINKSEIEALPVAYAPLDEQKRIVAKLDEAFVGLAKAKEKAEKNLQNARALFESHLQSVFTQRGPGWVEKPLETVASILNGYAFKSTDFSAKEGTKCIKITNVGVREFVSSSDGYLPESFAAEYEKVSVNEGSIVIALTRTIIAGGLKVAVVPEEYDGALLNQRVASIIANEKELNGAFLFAYLSTQTVVDYVKERVNTLMQPNLSITDLRSMPIPAPPRREQNKITEQLDFLREETQRLARLYEQKLEALESLKKSILHEAFSGNL